MLWVFITCAFAEKLVSVVHITRHGIRAPLIKYEWDTSPWNTSPGELTNTGIAQMNILGQEFRIRYIDYHRIISGKYNASEVYIRSTDFDRTISSAQAMMAGFFPSGPDLISDRNKYIAVPPFKYEGLEEALKDLGKEALPHKYQPVYIDMVGRQHDFLLLGFSRVCPKITEALKDAQNSAGYQRYKEKYETEIKAKLEYLLGKEGVEFEEAAVIGDSLETISASGYSLPSGIDHGMYSTLISIRDYCNSYMFDSPSVASLASSELFKYVSSFFYDVAHQKTSKKISFFFVHDTNFVGYLKFLQFWSLGNPPFASSLVFELYEDEDYYVMVKYNDEVVSIGDREDRKIRLSEFREIVDSVASKDVEKDCFDINYKMMKTYETNYFHTYIS